MLGVAPPRPQVGQVQQPLRVLVVDDSPLYRKVFSRVVAKTGFGSVAAEAESGEEAIALLAAGLDVDVVLLDVQMRGLDGFETMGRIREQHKGLPVILVSSVSAATARIAIRAVAAGAFDFVAKPRGVNAEAELRQQLGALLETLQAKRQLPAPPRRTVPIPRESRRIAPRFTMLALGSSTGGPSALMTLLPMLPADFPLPVVLVQHMPAGFTESLARQLDRVSSLEVREARDGDEVRAGTVLLAPGGRHMTVVDEGRAVRLVDSPPVHGVRPSVDILFRSLASSRPGAVLGVILTGMGRDGCDGVAALRRAKGYCLAQDEASCVVYGMPRAVADAGQADEVLSLKDIAPRIGVLARRGGHRI